MNAKSFCEKVTAGRASKWGKIGGVPKKGKSATPRGPTRVFEKEGGGL